MAIIYFVRDGAPPNNITDSKKRSVRYIIENFGTRSMKFLGNLADNIPRINEESGPAIHYVAPKYIVVKIEDKDPKSKRFPETGFYLIEGANPA